MVCNKPCRPRAKPGSSQFQRETDLSSCGPLQPWSCHRFKDGSSSEHGQDKAIQKDSTHLCKGFMKLAHPKDVICTYGQAGRADAVCRILAVACWRSLNKVGIGAPLLAHSPWALVAKVVKGCIQYVFIINRWECSLEGMPHTLHCWVWWWGIHSNLQQVESKHIPVQGSMFQ